MARHLSVATVIEKNRLHSGVAFIVCLDINVIDPVTGNLVETLHLARNPEDFVYQGKTYSKASFDLDIKEEAGSIPEIQVAARDHTRAIQARMQEYGGGVGFEVKALIVNSGNLDQPPEVEENFIVTAANVKGYEVTFTLGAENPLATRFPRRKQLRDDCQWRYKGPQCKYSGNLGTCDLSLQGPNGCAAHNNTPNFGAFPGITG